PVEGIAQEDEVLLRSGLVQPPELLQPGDGLRSSRLRWNQHVNRIAGEMSQRENDNAHSEHRHHALNQPGQEAAKDCGLEQGPSLRYDSHSAKPIALPVPAADR